MPGGAVAVIKDGKVIRSKGYGVRSLKTKAETDEQTLFVIGSNTKAFTASALGILVDEGKIKWDDKVRDYIPEFKLYNAYLTEEFTIRDLLCHRSGLDSGDLMFLPYSGDFTTKEILFNLQFFKPVSSFRTTFDYSCTFFIVAGEVVARVTGGSWDDFVEQRIMKPLGMTHTAGINNKLKNLSNITDPHVLVEGKLQAVDRDLRKTWNASSGIQSNLVDLSKWVLLHLHRGLYGNRLQKRLFSEDVHNELCSPQTIIPFRNAGSYNTQFKAYCLGLDFSDVKGCRSGGLRVRNRSRAC